MQKELIPFNKPYLSGKETEYIVDAVHQKMLSGNGAFTKKCHSLLEEITSSQKVLLTSSCTDALEMAAILLDIKPGDEVIMPSYTFVSTANAFVLRGATIRFVDSRKDHPGMDESLIEELINDRTKAIVVVHYAGVACDMDSIMSLAKQYDIKVVEDAAQAIDSYYKDRHLGSIGDLGTFSFHETKNIISGEGGCLAVNHSNYIERSEIIWEKGTNRAAFWRGEVDKYGWVDIGSSYLASDVTAAFLFAQLEQLDSIQAKRKAIWNYYHMHLQTIPAESVRQPVIPEYATNNAHMYYLITPDAATRDRLIAHLKADDIYGLFHYQSLHQSPYYKSLHDGRLLPLSDHYSNCLVRLPMYYDLSTEDQDRVIASLTAFFEIQ